MSLAFLCPVSGHLNTVNIKTTTCFINLANKPIRLYIGTNNTQQTVMEGACIRNEEVQYDIYMWRWTTATWMKLLGLFYPVHFCIIAGTMFRG